MTVLQYTTIKPVIQYLNICWSWIGIVSFYLYWSMRKTDLGNGIFSFTFEPEEKKTRGESEPGNLLKLQWAV